MMRRPTTKPRAFKLAAATLAVVIVSWWALAPHQATAQAPPTADGAGGISLSPGRLDVVLDKPGATATQELTLTNKYSSPLHLSAEFKGIDESTGRLVPQGEVQENLMPSLRLSETDIRIGANASRTFSVQVTDRPTLSPGGHYATLVLTPYAESEQNPLIDSLQVQTPLKSSLRSAISINLFVVKQAGAKSELALSNMKFKRWIFNLPSSVDLTFRNNGNIHGVPRSVVTLSAMDGQKQYLKGIANQQSVPLLPGKSLSDTVELSRLDRTLIPQRLQLQAQYRFDGQNSSRIISQSFWYIPAVYLLAVPVCAILIWFVLKRIAVKRIAKPLPPLPAAERLEGTDRGYTLASSVRMPQSKVSRHEQPKSPKASKPKHKKPKTKKKPRKSSKKPA